MVVHGEALNGMSKHQEPISLQPGPAYKWEAHCQEDITIEQQQEEIEINHK